MEIGYHTCNVVDKEIAESKNGALMCNVKVQFDNGETGIGRICLVKTDGSNMDKNIDDVRKIFGWNDDSLETLMAIPCDGIQVTVNVREEEYNNRIEPRIASVYPARKKASPDEIKSLASKFKSVLKAGATTSSIGKLSAQPKKEKAKVDDKPKTDEKSPSIETFEAFSKAFAFITDDSARNAKWFQFIGEVKGEMFDTDKATRDDWKDLYKAIDDFKVKCLKEQESGDTENVPF